MKLFNEVLPCEAGTLYFVLSAFISGSNGNLINVARFKPTSRSGPGQGEKAADGIRTTCMDVISQEANPYWKVDLGYPYYIDHIAQYCGEDFCGDITASVSLDDVTYTVLDDQPIFNDYYHFQPASPMAGRWVKMSRETYGYFVFCEVEVMSDQIYKGDSLHMRLIDGVVGSGPVLRTTNVGSAILCAQLCMEEKLCVSTNVITDVTSSTLLECQLLGSMTQVPAVDINTVYYEITFE